jgi:hypothetical protein
VRSRSQEGGEGKGFGTHMGETVGSWFHRNTESHPEVAQHRRPSHKSVAAVAAGAPPCCTALAVTLLDPRSPGRRTSGSALQCPDLLHIPIAALAQTGAHGARVRVAVAVTATSRRGREPRDRRSGASGPAQPCSPPCRVSL